VQQMVQVSRYRGRSDICLSPAFNSLHLYPFQQAATMPLQINILHTGRKERHYGSVANTLVHKTVEALQLNGKGERTQQAYARAVRMLIRFLMHSMASIISPFSITWFNR
jgi:hypothetical protein